jgi:hypothetical protein
MVAADYVPRLAEVRLLHTGPRPFRLSERIFALPIATLWG